MRLTDLPGDVIVNIGNIIQDPWNLFSLMQTNQYCYKTLAPLLSIVNCCTIMLDGSKIILRDPLFCAVARGQLWLVKRLVEEQNYDIDTVENGLIPLHIAAMHDFGEILQYLLDKGAELYREGRRMTRLTALHWAVMGRHHEIVEILIDRGHRLEVRDENGETPFYLAAFEGHVDMVELLLENGADPDARNQLCITPLWATAHTGNSDIVELLLEHKVDVNPWLKQNGNTALYEAAVRGHTDVVDLLLRSKAHPNIANSNRCSPLHRAVESGYTEIVQLLLDSGADVDLKDVYNESPIFWAIKTHQKDMYRLLHDHGASLELINTDGITAAEYAVKLGFDGWQMEIDSEDGSLIPPPRRHEADRD